MNWPWESLLKIPATFLEAGLMAMNTGARTLQAGLETLTGGEAATNPKGAPVNGPRNLDGALSELATRLLLIGRLTPPDSAGIVKAMGEVFRAAQRSFGYLDPRGRGMLALPMALPLSAAGLLSEILMRGMAAYSVLGPRRLAIFAGNVMELYSEVGLYVGLEYKDLIERYKERLRQEPDDFATRAELGRAYVKLGLYDQAVRELSLAAADPSTRALAMHESAVANYRAGRFGQALKDGVEAMAANPGNERARSILWLSSRSLGGYPASVPAEYRMDVASTLAKRCFDNLRSI